MDFRSKRILVTGHTGFTGSWACQSLLRLGATVCGYALAPASPSHFELLRLPERMESIIGDINDYEMFQRAVERFRPDAILHLAAQPLVRAGYRDPLGTFKTNVMGTANVFEAARLSSHVRAVLCITTDKVYENNETGEAFTERSPLGGKDPYSASKAAAEMVAKSYASAGWQGRTDELATAVARGGNIIGGGDWSEDRLIPDFVRAVVSGRKIEVRYPDSVRPWQHVLALVDGYFRLLSGLLDDPARYAGAWNLGPADDSPLSVQTVLDLLAKEWRAPDIEYVTPELPESRLLSLDSSRARDLLDWRPGWDAERAIRETARWYRAYAESPDAAADLTDAQIAEWFDRASTV